MNKLLTKTMILFIIVTVFMVKWPFSLCENVNARVINVEGVVQGTDDQHMLKMLHLQQLL